MIFKSPDAIIVVGNDEVDGEGIILFISLTDTSCKVDLGLKITSSTKRISLYDAMYYEDELLVIGALYSTTSVDPVVLNISSNNLINSITLSNISIERISPTLNEAPSSSVEHGSISVTIVEGYLKEVSSFGCELVPSYSTSGSVQTVYQVKSLPLRYEGIIGGTINIIGDASSTILSMNYEVNKRSKITLNVNLNLQSLHRVTIKVFNTTSGSPRLICSEAFEAHSSISGSITLGLSKPFNGIILLEKPADNNGDSNGGLFLGGILSDHSVLYLIIFIFIIVFLSSILTLKKIS